MSLTITNKVNKRYLIIKSVNNALGLLYTILTIKEAVLISSSNPMIVDEAVSNLFAKITGSKKTSPADRIKKKRKIIRNSLLILNCSFAAKDVT